MNVAAIAATVVAAATAWFNFRSGPLDDFAQADVKIVDGWQLYAAQGARIGPEAAAVTITVFSDYTCPHCKEAFLSVRDLMRRHPDDLALVVRHFPLSNGVGRDAAIAAECGRRFGAFRRLHNMLLANSDSLGTKTWGSLAFAAGISDTVAFSTCLTDSTAMAAVARDLRAGYRLGVSLTPAILVNGRFFEGNPPRRFLQALVQDRLAAAEDASDS